MIINVVTGFGYFTDSNGHIVNKVKLPLGITNIGDNMTYTEVADQQTLDAIQIYIVPLSPVDAFNLDQFVRDLNTTFTGSAALMILPYYAVFKDLAAYKDFTTMKQRIIDLRTNGIVNDTIVNAFKNILLNQGIDLDNLE